MMDGIRCGQRVDARGQGVADGVGATHEINVAKAAGFICIKVKALISTLRFTRLAAEAIKQTHDCQ